MIIEIFAETPDDARKKLDEKGGYITERNVSLLTATPLLRPDVKTPQKKTFKSSDS